MDNINQLLNIDFSAVNDEFNWLNNTETPITTISNQLKLVPDASTSEFNRGLGTLDPTNDRIRVQCNLDLYRPQTSLDETMTVLFGVYIGSTLIDQFSIYIETIGSGEIIEYNFDRIYKYDSLSGAISLKISTPEGFTNQIFLDYLKAYDGKFNENEVRSYFAIDGFLDESLTSVSSGVQLLEWKIDGVETLTADFFIDNPSVGGDPNSVFKMAKSEIDGSGRVAELTDPNTFNPFVNEFGLTFENVAGNYFGGKPIGTATGNDYGQGILTIGFEKPSILNGNLDQRNGAFFIDIDYSKNLFITFNVLVNNTNVDVFDSPVKYRKYFISWNASTCVSSFTYQDIISANPTTKIQVNEDGFLSGLTGKIGTATVIGCDESFSYSGSSGVFEFQIDFGIAIGEAGIDFNAISIPDKFEIEWNGQIFSSGFVGSNSNDQQLLNLGFSPSEINTGSGTASGQLLFQKTLASPSIATIRVTAPLAGTAWNISGICPDGIVLNPPTVEISTIKTIYELNEDVTFNVVANDTDGTIASWIIDFGDQTIQSGTGTPPLTIVKSYSNFGEQTITMTVTDNDGLEGSDTLVLNTFSNSQYTITGTTFIGCSQLGMAGSIQVFSGTIVVQNKFTDIQGTPTSADVTIDGVVLGENDQKTLSVGTYPFTSTVVGCASGNGYNELIVL